MSKRLQVILDDEEMEEIRRFARRQHMSVAEWVRAALRQSRKDLPTGNAEKKIKIIRSSIRHEFPSGDIEIMLADIESGAARE